MKFFFECRVWSKNPERIIENWSTPIEAPNEIDAMFLAREQKRNWESEQTDLERLSVRMTLRLESNNEPFWFSERGKLQKQSDSS